MSTAQPSNAALAPAQDTPVEQMTMMMAKEMILMNLFRRFAGTRPELDGALMSAYKKKFGREMRQSSSGRDVRAMYLEGIPGHGKTTTHREALREFTALVGEFVPGGLKFMDEPTFGQLTRNAIDKRTVVFSTLTVAGATSKHEVGGLMAKMSIGDQQFMGHLPDWRLAATMMGAYGYVLFDDFPTAAHPVQNACLDLLLGGSAGNFQFNIKELAASDVFVKDGTINFSHNEKTAAELDKIIPENDFRGASPVHIGLAGNRGSRDGNKVFPITTATATRVQRADVIDTAEDFIARAQKRFPDSIGDAYYSVFIKNNPEIFSAIAKPTNGILPAMPVPRTHDALMDEIGVLVHNAGGFDKLTSDANAQATFLQAVQRSAGTHIGRTIEVIESGASGSKVLAPAAMVAGFYSEMLLGALPRADAIIRKGVVDEEFIRNKWNNGQDSDGMNFGYQFANALGQIAAVAIADVLKANPGKGSAVTQLADVEGPLAMKMREVMKHFSYGLTFLSKPMISLAIDKFNSRANVFSPELFEGNNPNYRTPSIPFITMMIYGMVRDNTKYPVEEIKGTFADSLSRASTVVYEGLDSTIMDDLKNRRKAIDDARKAAMAPRP